MADDSSSDSEVFVQPRPVRGGGGGRGLPSARSPGRGIEEAFESLESVTEALEDAQRAMTALAAALSTLEAEAKECPLWLRPALDDLNTSDLTRKAASACEVLAAEVCREKELMLAEAGGGGGHSASKAVKMYLAALRSYHTKCAKKLDAVLKATFPADEPPAGSPTLPAAVPPPVPARTPPTVAPRKSAAAPVVRSQEAGADDDPFAEQPIHPVDSRARSKSGLPLAATPVRQPPPTPLSLSATPPPGPSSADDSSSSPRSTSPRDAKPPPDVLSLSGSGRGSAPRRLLGRRGPAESALKQSSTEAVPAAEVALAPLEWGSASNPLRQLCERTDLDLAPEGVIRFEAQKSGLLMSSRFSLTVSSLAADPHVAVYDVKQQTNVVRPIAHVHQVTRSNKDPRKLKIHWRGDATDRFLFGSAEERERFFEAVWTARRAVPQPTLYAEAVDVFVGTWNLGDAMPPSELESWLHPNAYDVYAVSAQEAGYEMDKGDKGKGQSNAEQHFFALVASNLGPDYAAVAQVSLLHIRLCVFVAKRHLHKVSNVRKGAVATGIGNVIGNKGGCFVSLSLNETSFCFVGCHLAAREERYEVRITNVQQILQGINAEQPAGLGPEAWFDYVFWTGDLNFRLEAPRDDVCRWAVEGNVAQLLTSDQLLRARRQAKLFFEWVEPPITFTPSYRFDRGSSAFSLEKMRTPSYCDRVLYWSRPGNVVNVTRYDCDHSLTTSDHHPVFCTMQVDTRLPSPATQRPVPVFVELTDLVGREMNYVALEREPPFISFFSPLLLHNGASTKRSVIRGKTPKWPDAMVPRLQCLVAARAVVALGHLVLAVRDGKNEVGQGVLALVDGCGPQPADFVLALHRDGLPAGELRGRFMVRWGGGADEDSAVSYLASSIEYGVGSSIGSSGGASSISGSGVTGNSGGGGGGGVGGPEEAPLKTGFLLKQGSKVKSWKRRWFVFAANGELSYYADAKGPRCLDKLRVASVAAVAAEVAGKKNCISVESDQRRKLLFCADNTADFDAWMAVLSNYCASRAKAE